MTFGDFPYASGKIFVFIYIFSVQFLIIYKLLIFRTFIVIRSASLVRTVFTWVFLQMFITSIRFFKNKSFISTPKKLQKFITKSILGMLRPFSISQIIAFEHPKLSANVLCVNLAFILKNRTFSLNMSRL